ncbi:MAG TPA: MBL fold metallo-hydrolase [Candidatus Saccharimonadales bacterium]|nr:MBL fold metallo-hydrolase [Candidatus Saccharimonadales bacterium]
MKVTKLGHSCLLVEMPSPVNRTALFDPGTLSTVNVTALQYLDDIFITHADYDHFDASLVQELVAKFPEVRITTTPEVVAKLKEQGITASSDAPEGVAFFDSPHELIRPLYAFDPAQEIGVHYLNKLSHPGDSHSFHETKDVLALPVTAPWGHPVRATELALELKPRYIVPIHDWHWSDAARESNYATMEKLFTQHNITFIKAVNGEPFVLDDV